MTAERIPITRPTLPPLENYTQALANIWASGQITNGTCVRELEARVAAYLGSSRCVAMANCTGGLILALKALNLHGAVICPSFTFFATAHTLLWNGLEPVFADVDAESWNLDPASVEAILEERSDISAILGVHIFGNPCEVERLTALAEKFRVRLVFDAAHAMGSEIDGRKVGCFGDVEVFSLSPTKPLVAAEGGVASTGRSDLAEILDYARDYGNRGDYDPAFVGLNSRMSELHAVLGLAGLELLEGNIERRNQLAARYRANLVSAAGIRFQAVRETARSTYKDLTVSIHTEEFGVDRDVLAWHLGNEGIDTRKYYFPAVHRSKAYWDRWGRACDGSLPVTNELSRQVLSLPLWSHMEIAVVDRVCEAVQAVRKDPARAEETFRASH